MRNGWTLLECLLVCALVGGLFMTSLGLTSGFRERALSTHCKANLHQLAGLCQTYAQAEGFYPWGMISPTSHFRNYYSNAGKRLFYPRENPLHYGVTNWSDYATFCWDFIRKNDEKEFWQCGPMFRGLQIETMIRCPKCAAGTTDNWDSNLMTGYNYNVCFIGYVENDKSTRNYPLAVGQIQYPERVVVFGDGGYSGGVNKFMRAPFQDKFYDCSGASLRKAGTQAFRHGTGRRRHCNMAFLDGHVEEFKQPYKAGGQKGWVYEKTHTGFISSGNGIYGPRGWGVADREEPSP